MSTDTPTTRVYVPPAIGRKPTTPQEALLSAAALLEEEGRWVQGVYYRNAAQGTPEYVDDPYCNGWGTCAIGALQCVTIGVHQYTGFDYSSSYDHQLESWPRLEKWNTPEDEYAPFVDGYYDKDDFAELSDVERIYVEAHQVLDIETAASTTFEHTIGFNDDEHRTREDVIALFHRAAERAAAAKVTADG